VGRLKRLFDLLMALSIAMVITIPMVLIAIAVRLTSKGPALYWSDRVGHGKSTLAAKPLKVCLSYESFSGNQTQLWC